MATFDDLPVEIVEMIFRELLALEPHYSRSLQKILTRETNPCPYTSGLKYVAWKAFTFNKRPSLGFSFVQCRAVCKLWRKIIDQETKDAKFLQEDKEVLSQCKAKLWETGPTKFEQYESPGHFHIPGIEAEARWRNMVAGSTSDKLTPVKFTRGTLPEPIIRWIDITNMPYELPVDEETT